MNRRDNSRTIRARTGPEIKAKSWATEAAVRMLMNNLDPDVAEAPEELVVYGGIGRAARDWESFDRIVETLERLEDDETLLVQSGKPVGVFRTHADAPRVLIANSNLVPKWATWDHFNHLDRKGLMMYGQMTAGSWIYIGTQGIVQGTYETFAEMGRQHYGGDLKGKLDPDRRAWRHGRRPAARGGDGRARIALRSNARRAGSRRGWRPAISTAAPRASTRRWRSSEPRRRRSRSDCSAMPPRSSRDGRARHPARTRSPTRPPPTIRSTAIFRSAGASTNGSRCASAIPRRWRKRRAPRWRSMSRRCSPIREMGVPTFDYGNNIRQVAKDEGVTHAFDFPGFVPAYVRPLFCRGIGPFRWAALSGDPEDIYRTDARVKELIPDDPHLHRWLDMARERIAFQGLPARICWVGLGQRHRLGLAFNEMVASGELKAPVVIGRDHLDSGSVASPNRETEAMKDGSDAVSDWPLLNALLNTASGATWVSLHHGGGVGMGYSQHAGMVIVADGTPEAARTARARAVERSRHRRHAPRRCGLSGRDRLRPRAGPGFADGGTMTMFSFVIPAKAGISGRPTVTFRHEIPAFAGMTRI